MRFTKNFFPLTILVIIIIFLDMPRFDYQLIKGLDEELKITLFEKYKIEELDIEDVYTSTQLSKIEQRKDYLYVALQFPEYDKVKRHFDLKEIHCFINPGYFLVIDKDNFKHLNQFDNLKETFLSHDYDSFDVFYEMLDFFVTKIFRVIGKFRAEIADLERGLFDEGGDKEDLITEIQIIKRNLINFTSIISPLKTLIEEMQTKYTAFIDADGKEFLDDSLDKVKKMMNNLGNFRDQMVMITETNESLIARNTNETIKILTAVNLIAVVPTALASFFGMNLYFGWDVTKESLLPFLAITSLILAATLATYIYFKKKKWF